MERRIYIAGPITGLPDNNRPLFADATRQLRCLGLLVINPHELCQGIPSDSPWSDYMRTCISSLTRCTDIVLLTGWENSRGANIEHMVSVQLELSVYYGMDEFIKQNTPLCNT